MELSKNKPDFLIIWKSLMKTKKTDLKNEFCKASGDIGHVTFFRKKKSSDWTELEKEWWAKKLKISVTILFPKQ
jgi:hypothetical protein